MYKRSGNQWNPQATVVDPGDASNDLFGRSVSTSGNEVLAGAVDVAYVFTNASGHEWTQTAVLRNPGSAKDNFGYGVNLDGTTAAIGAPGGVPGTLIGSPLTAGAAYVFTMKGSTWSTPKVLTAPAGTKGDEFGISVTETGNRLLIGMPVYGKVNCGTAFAFSPGTGTWVFQEQVLNPSCTQGDKFGFSASLSGATGVIGAPGVNNGTGAAFFLSLPPTSPEAVFQDPNGTGVGGVALSTACCTVAAGDTNGSTYLWDATNHTLTATLRNPNGQGVYGAAFSPDGKTLAVGTVNSKFNAGSVYLWGVSSHKVTATLQDPNGRGVVAVAFSPNGTTLAAGDDNGNTYLWNVSTHKLITTLSDPASQGVSGVAFTQDGTTLATADSNGHAYVWNVSSHKLLATLSDPASQGVNGVAFAPNTNSATADGNGHVYEWEAPGKLIDTLSDPASQSVSGVAFNSDGTALAATTTNKTHTESGIYVWDVATGSLIATFHNPASEGNFRLAFSPHGSVLAVGDANARTYLWDMSWLGS
jgi:WD40 repeat protein